MTFLFVLTAGIAISASSATPAAADDPPLTCMSYTASGNTPSLDVGSALMGGVVADQVKPLWADPVDGRGLIVDGKINRQLGARNPDGTLYEQFGMSGATWSATSAGRQKSGGFLGIGESGFDVPGTQSDDQDKEWNCDVLASSAINTMANGIFGLAKLISAATITIRQTAANPQPFINILQQLSDPVEKMRSQLYAVLVVAAVGLAGFSMIKAGLFGGGKQRQAIQAVGMSLLLVLTGTFLMNRTDGMDYSTTPPTKVTNQSAYYLLTSGAMNKMDDLNGFMASLLLRDPGPGDICSATGSDVARRAMDCQIYKMTVFEPWAVGQFGDGADKNPLPLNKDQPLKLFGGTAGPYAPNTDLRVVQLYAQGKTNAEVAAAAHPGDRQAQERSIQRDPSDSSNMEEANPTSSQGAWNMVREGVYQQHHDRFNAWNGKDSAQRLQMAIVAIVMAILIGSLMLLTSILLLFYNVMIVVLFFALPLVALVGVVPAGQAVFKGWLKKVVQALGMIGAFQIVQILALFLMSTVLGAAMGLFIKGLLLVLMAVGVLKLLKYLQTAGPQTAFDMPTVTGKDLGGAAKKVHDSRAGKAMRQGGKATNAAAFAGVAAGVRRAKEANKLRPDVKKLNEARKSNVAKLADQKLRGKELTAATSGKSMSWMARQQAQWSAKREAEREVEAAPSIREQLGKETSVGAAMKRGFKGGATAKKHDNMLGVGLRESKMSDANKAAFDARAKGLAERAQKAAEADTFRSRAQRAQDERAQQRADALRKAGGAIGSKAAGAGRMIASATVDTSVGQHMLTSGRNLAGAGYAMSSRAGGEVAKALPGTSANRKALEGDAMEQQFRREEYKAFTEGKKLSDSAVEKSKRRLASFEQQEAGARAMAKTAQKQLNEKQKAFAGALEKDSKGEISVAELNRARREFEASAKAAEKQRSLERDRRAHTRALRSRSK